LAHDGSRELWFGDSSPIGAIPVADHSVEPLRGRKECRFAGDKFKLGLVRWETTSRGLPAIGFFTTEQPHACGG